MQQIQYRSNNDNWTIQAFRWPCVECRGIVVLSHGMAEHALRYDRFAIALNSAGYDVWAMDHRAHGTTFGPDGMGDFGTGGWDALVEDIGQLIDLAGKAIPGSPVVLFGHSMGAAAAQQFAPTGSGKVAAILSESAYWRKRAREFPELLEFAGVAMPPSTPDQK